MALALSEQDRGKLHGEEGKAVEFAFKILTAFSESVGASSLLDIVGSHIDGCLYHGQVSLDFVERLVSLGGRVKVPTTLNVGSMDLIHPELMLHTDDQRGPMQRLMKAHEDLGCLPSFTCTPYQTMFRPRFGEQIAWGESSAIVFANSVIGARTNRYGDFIDLCCAVTGRAPAWGLHLDENRLGQLHYQLSGFSDDELASDATFVGVGLLIGLGSGEQIPVVEGLPRPRDEDQLKALGAAAASSGAVGLFHVVGVTPEAPTLSQAFGGRQPLKKITITPEDVHTIISHLSKVRTGTAITAVCLGTPHFSRAEWDRFLPILHEVAPASGIPIYVNTGRETYAGLLADGSLAGCERFNVKVVTDTCTYITSILEDLSGAVMTNSGKWAHYAPSNIGVQVAFGDLEDCIRSAAAARVVRAAA